jgi:glucose uptake protein GlcU
MTARGTERFRNYNSVLKRHEENKRIKKVIRVFGFFAIILIVIMLIVFLSRWEERVQEKSKGNTSNLKASTELYTYNSF